MARREEGRRRKREEGGISEERTLTFLLYMYFVIL